MTQSLRCGAAAQDFLVNCCDGGRGGLTFNNAEGSTFFRAGLHEGLMTPVIGRRRDAKLFSIQNTSAKSQCKCVLGGTPPRQASARIATNASPLGTHWFHFNRSIVHLEVEWQHKGRNADLPPTWFDMDGMVANGFSSCERIVFENTSVHGQFMNMVH